MNRAMRLLAAVAAMVLAVSTARAETVEEVEKKLNAAAAKVTAYTADVKMTLDSGAEGMKLKGASKGTYEWAREGSKVLYRMEQHMSQTIIAGAQTNSTNTHALTVNDGEFIHTLNDAMGVKSATRQRSDAKADQPVFEGMRNGHNLKLMPDETIDGVAVYVVEGRPKDTKGANPDAGRILQFFSKETGLVLKIVQFDTGGNPMMTMEYNNMKVNPKIAPDRFKFTAPAGVQVQDLTAPGGK